MAPHPRTLAWKIPWTEKPGGLQSIGLLESDTTERLHFHFSLSCIGKQILDHWPTREVPRNVILMFIVV